ncbi:5-formyltetrahydrofolate cyclo-ligase [Pseudothauera nasutitermitis]|uniref:5-formyltetrahydrofolate cyclo-ligase n=1 Tax=Pseudothauera nasutitermitis TaxID=2565930 RepID=A0A4S4AY88_9RHOO|nr:5-formyltetrahydrofolate cyclo-ligase [Pseudothauera nasutitermitis]THF64616.1 5-formyltetrahydrofolate cyclo-ligase [Pseudothauera nasutitermitis]
MNDASSAVTPAPEDARRRLRAQAVARREALDANTRAGLETRIETHLDTLCADLSPGVLAFCWPWRGEPDLRAWMSRWQAGGARRTAALPVVLERDHPLVFRRWSVDVPMAVDRHGIPYPESGEALVPDAVLIPLNAFDAAGYRLGYGGGYFDRTLAALPMVAIGVGFELGRADSVLPQSHDRPMDWLVTEAGVFRPGVDQPRNSR